MKFREELIGKNAEVVNSLNLSLIGLNGKIIDETKNLIVFEQGKIVSKNVVHINVENKYFLNGALLVGKPEDRLKAQGDKNE
jgi:ribonuclease P protein subunit POP4